MNNTATPTTSDILALQAASRRIGALSNQIRWATDTEELARIRAEISAVAKPFTRTNH